MSKLIFSIFSISGNQVTWVCRILYFVWAFIAHTELYLLRKNGLNICEPVPQKIKNVFMYILFKKRIFGKIKTK